MEADPLRIAPGDQELLAGLGVELVVAGPGAHVVARDAWWAGARVQARAPAGSLLRGRRRARRRHQGALARGARRPAE